MKSVAIDVRGQGNEIEALKSTAKSIREGYGAGTLIKVGAPYFHTDSDCVGYWTSHPESWTGEFEANILIESEHVLTDYEMAALVESKIKQYQCEHPKWTDESPENNWRSECTECGIKAAGSCQG